MDLYTDPKQAIDFVKATQVDASAVTIGTAYVNYPKGKIPKINFQGLQELKQALKIPLVLHGSSGSVDENISKAVKYGINKVNVATDAFECAKSCITKSLNKQPDLDYIHLCMSVETGLKNFVKSYIHI